MNISQQTIWGFILFLYYCFMIYVLARQVIEFKWHPISIGLLILNCGFLYYMTVKYWAICQTFFTSVGSTKLF